MQILFKIKILILFKNEILLFKYETLILFKNKNKCLKMLTQKNTHKVKVVHIYIIKNFHNFEICYFP